MGSVPQPVFGQWFGIEKLVRECQNGDNENIQPNEIVNIQSKVSEPGEEHSLLIESDSIEKRIEELKRIQCRHKDLEIDYLEKRAKLKDDYLNGCKVVHEQGWNEFLLSKLKTTEVLADEDWRLIHPAKYQNWFRDLYKERFEIVNGATEVRELNTKGGVPEFWLKAMKNNEVLAEEITERDEGALKYLQDIEWRRLGSRARGGFELKFIFAHNPYFENSSLLKQFTHEQTSASEINWRHGQSLTHKLIVKPGKRGKPMSKTCESFFNFFTSRSVPHPTEDTYPYTPSKATVEGFKAQLRYDFHIGKIIRDKIIPHAIAWVTKEALQKSSEFHDLEDGMDECDGNEDDDERDINFGGWGIFWFLLLSIQDRRHGF
ncbi:hypothetical protein ACLB2K_054252 [Fragaria x ananassa]